MCELQGWDSLRVGNFYFPLTGGCVKLRGRLDSLARIPKVFKEQ